MAMPSIKSKKAKSKGRKASPKKVNKTAKAVAAVKRFDEEYETLQTMKKNWKKKFPKAHDALQQIKEQEDIVTAAMEKAKPLVAEAKETVGGFKCVRKWSSPHYDDKKVTDLIYEAENAADIIAEMFLEGVIKVLELDELATPWIAKRPEYSEFFKDAWVDRKEKTPAVSMPKI